MAGTNVVSVDCGERIRVALAVLVGAVRLKVSALGSAQDFLDAYQHCTLGCLVLVLRMPGIGGLELQKELEGRGGNLPIIFLSGHGDVEVAVHAMKAGAIDFIEKPFSHQLLLDRIQSALSAQQERPQSRSGKVEESANLSHLTKREREVLEKLIVGKINKVVARELDISPKTVEFHRSNIMKKMNAHSLADLIEKVTCDG